MGLRSVMGCQGFGGLDQACHVSGVAVVGQFCGTVIFLIFNKYVSLYSQNSNPSKELVARACPCG